MKPKKQPQHPSKKAKIVAKVKQIAGAHWRRSRNKKPQVAGTGPQKPPVLRRLFVSDITCEAVVRVLEENPLGLLVWRDEIAGWFRGFNEYKRGRGSDKENWLSTFQAGRWIVDRKGADPLMIWRAAVSVTGTITPSAFATLLSREDIEDGFVPRLLLTWPPDRPMQLSDKSVDPRVMDAARERLEQILALAPNGGSEQPIPVPLKLSPEARELFKQWYNRHASEAFSFPPPLRSVWAKLQRYCPRFALVLALARNPQAAQVEKRDMEGAIRLADWFGNEAQRVLYELLRVKPQEGRGDDRVLQWIQERGEVSPNELMNKFRKRFPRVAKAEKFLDEQVHLGNGRWLPSRSGPKGGRPKRLFCWGS